MRLGTLLLGLLVGTQGYTHVVAPKPTRPPISIWQRDLSGTTR
jgi:hypothetical protein